MTAPYNTFDGANGLAWAQVASGMFPVAHPIVKCPACGNPMVSIPGAHAPRHQSGRVVDCIGRPCSIGPDGYYRAELATTNDTREAA